MTPKDGETVLGRAESGCNLGEITKNVCRDANSWYVCVIVELCLHWFSIFVC